MNTSTVKSRFLSHPEDLGIVTVGFSGGQVRFQCTLSRLTTSTHPPSSTNWTPTMDFEA